MRILHALSQRPDATGSGIYIQAMIREARSAGHENYLLAGIPGDFTPDPAIIQKDRCRFVRFDGGDLSFPIVGMSDVMPYPSRRFRDLDDNDLAAYRQCFVHALKETIASFQPDIVHSHHLWLMTAVLKRHFPDLPVVTSCHGSDLRQFQHCAHLREDVGFLGRRLNGIFALSPAQKEDIVRLYEADSRRVHVVGAGYNDALFHPALKPPPSPVQIVYAGKFSRAKGVPWMLRALAQMKGLDWHLNLVGAGSGPEADECRMLAGRLGGRVTLIDPLPQEKLAECFQKCHVFVLPSLFEGLPLVLLEALACGCRLVATALPGVETVVGALKNHGVSLVDLPRLAEVDQPVAEDETAFEKALVRSMTEQVQAVSNGAALDEAITGPVLASYNWKQVFQRINRVYADVSI